MFAPGRRVQAFKNNPPNNPCTEQVPAGRAQPTQQPRGEQMILRSKPDSHP